MPQTSTKRKPGNKLIEVILLLSDKHLGEKYEIVKVKPVFARNILLPRNIAVLADAKNKNTYEQKMKAAEVDRQKKATGLDDVFTKILNDGGIVLTRKANKDNTLYAKVDEHDIAEAIKTIYGIDIESHYFKLKKKLTAIGQFTVPFLYKDMKKEVIVKIEADAEEEKKNKRSEEKSDEKPEEKKIAKTKEEIKAEKEEARKIKKEETLKRLKEKYK